MIFDRFCAKDYLPFDEEDRQKYVVDDNYTPAWEVQRGGVPGEIELFLLI